MQGYARLNLLLKRIRETADNVTNSHLHKSAKLVKPLTGSVLKGRLGVAPISA